MKSRALKSMKRKDLMAHALVKPAPSVLFEKLATTLTES